MTIRLDILEMGARGDGIAELEGERYFVPFALPGEVVEAEPLDARGEGTATRLIEVLAPSRHRETPPCAHFTVCGGCALQHWRRDVYTAWKIGLVERALKQRGVEAPAFEPPMIGVPGERRRADFVLRRQGRRVLAGFHERASARIVDVGTCVVARPSLTSLLEPLRAALVEVLPDGAAADAVVNETDSGLDVLLRPHKRLDLSIDLRQALAVMAEQADLARLSWGDRARAEPIVMRRAPLLVLGDATVQPPPGAFLQATKRGEQVMRAAVAAWAGPTAHLADLFAGIGALSLGRGGRLSLFESDVPSVEAAQSTARKIGDNRVHVERRDLFRRPLTVAELQTFEAVLLDPPRAGAAAQTSELASSRVARIVYASCDPGSFARDARILQDGGYRLEKLMPIDQFLWSTHLELIALFSRR
ncbi:23S rRNA (uracil1939-C5)-methyltransferase [Enhydrobacter aerosaccus]|uniref:23S rRNA (Uracil1939-C5)-methyltransferase n=1 Tax=Enhydrobacter aerosaccus TaxID=225324 RepID=A0A1T4KU31_9HYPH|nr:class I SAM-dependent RNA methyltransferase [Enhydrobacter aerosaccus]SJZ45906.1 23S rRNA (uracil1939-C5)-methyltransferase [Enhydrobacter aerosaccus]